MIHRREKSLTPVCFAGYKTLRAAALGIDDALKATKITCIGNRAGRSGEYDPIHTDSFEQVVRTRRVLRTGRSRMKENDVQNHDGKRHETQNVKFFHFVTYLGSLFRPQGTRWVESYNALSGCPDSRSCE